MSRLRRTENEDKRHSDGVTSLTPSRGALHSIPLAISK
ncbi:hypothetical protein BU14_0855s0004 [Porphyra umbilicalis]|uniref:Uncharacterized protein n=1 Tax=Porphyra umbilicalis TaxID=2786 RepID=A0A1X6NNN1_PORUM|nr:hypothetical protein BU14_0855s0004 [Porphyra umbilicalis]|eukprot:OSX70208.1 hypothetical protein BU14_0855s0004 [Porphyra umbilicalis]